MGTVVKTVDATDKRDAYVVINPETVNPGIGNKEFETTQEFEDDSYVLYTYSESAKEIKSVEPAQKVEGVVTRAENTVTNDTDKAALTIDGQRYTASAKVSGENLSDVSVDEQYTVYLDSYGYLIYVERIDEIGDYALMIQANAGDIFNSKKAALIFADGTTAVVNTAKHYDEEELNVDTNGDGDKNDAASPVIVTYRKDADGVYTLRAVTSGTGSVSVANDTDFTLVNDKAGIENVGQPTNKVVTANSASTFVVRDPSNARITDSLGDWTSYTGIKNAPSITAKAGTDEDVDVYYYCKSGSMVTIMFIVPAEKVVINDGVNKSIFLAGDSVSNLIHDKNGDYYEYEAVVNGEIKTVKVDESRGKNLNGMYKSYSVDKYGVITNLYPYVGTTAEKGLFTGVGIDKVSKEYTVILNTANADMNGDRTPDGVHTITVDEDANFFYVNEDGKISASSYNGIAIDGNDKVWAIVDDYMVQTLVIAEVEGDSTVTPPLSDEVDVKSVSVTNSAITIRYYVEDGTAHTFTPNEIGDLLTKEGWKASFDGSWKVEKGYEKYTIATVNAVQEFQVTVKVVDASGSNKWALKSVDTNVVIEGGTVKVKVTHPDWAGDTRTATVTAVNATVGTATVSFTGTGNVSNDISVVLTSITKDVTVTVTI